VRRGPLSVLTVTLVLCHVASPGVAGGVGPGHEASPQILRLASSYSCSPRKTCSKTIRSCEEAYWLLQNCSWGGALDRDKDGVPCETLCLGG
jgi:hypothetical protein